MRTHPSTLYVSCLLFAQRRKRISLNLFCDTLSDRCRSAHGCAWDVGVWLAVCTAVVSAVTVALSVGEGLLGMVIAMCLELLIVLVVAAVNTCYMANEPTDYGQPTVGSGVPPSSLSRSNKVVPVQGSEMSGVSACA